MVLPVLAVVIVIAAWTAGLLRPMARAMRIPALLLLSILVVNSLFFPGGTDKLVTLGPLSITREGLTFGLISAGRVLVAFLASVAFLFTTLADDMLESLIARGASYRIAFVVLSAVQLVPRMRVARGRDPRGAAGARPVARRLVRAPHPVARAVDRAGAARVAGGRPGADVRARGARVRRHGRIGPPIGSSPTRRSTAGFGCWSCWPPSVVLLVAFGIVPR